jgi:tetratricopeptide (TPR) repeat protein
LTLSRVVAIAALVVSLAGAAHAQPTTPPSADARASARLHYEAGKRKYSLGQFDAAVQEFQAAYEAVGDAVILFNIAQSYRFAGNHERALFFYKSYLRENPPNRAEVEKRIAELTETVAREQREKTAPPTGLRESTEKTEKLPVEREKPPEHAVTTTPQPPPPPPPPPKPRSPAIKYSGFALAGLAVAALAVGGAMSGLAGNASSDVTKAAAVHGGVFTTDLQHTESDGKLYDNVSIAMYTVGGLAAAAAVVTLYLGLRPDPALQHAAVVPVLSPSQAGLALTGQF